MMMLEEWTIRVSALLEFEWNPIPELAFTATGSVSGQLRDSKSATSLFLLWERWTVSGIQSLL
jgi:hypothetical protein